MRPRDLLWTGAAVLVAGCAGMFGTRGHDQRTVLVDYDHDEVASTFMAYFPNDLKVHAGDEVVFRQQWTGEGHSVTMGTYADRVMEIARPLMAKYPDEEPPPEVLGPFMEVFGKLPIMVNDNLEVNQNGAQPCFLDEGLPPTDPDTPCTDAKQQQPAFNGRQSYYNSGFIPYDGPRGNEFRVQLSDDIEPGAYSYYCNLHSVFQNGTIEVVPDDQAIPSQAEVSRQAYDQIKATAAPLLRAYRDAIEAEGETEVVGLTVSKPFAGWLPATEATPAWINEFVPRRTEVEVGQSLTWSFVGGHTVSFNVPAYFSEFIVEPDGTVEWTRDAVAPRGRRLGSDASEPAGGPSEGTTDATEASSDPPSEGASEPPSEGASEPRDTVIAEEPADAATDGPGEQPAAAPTEGAGEEAPGEAGDPAEPAAEEEGGPPEGQPIDAGRWDGEGFLSSGVQFGTTFSVTFTRPGVYPYACLIHPRMVGEVVVR
jgi:plastocyanin